ncbi:probable chitinase 10 [Ornithodoros turicata]|uniref:probable chitinase 10 n=1 Tax=Ornithodoros turicata TaxID=34597 RepID=UPI003139F6DC
MKAASAINSTSDAPMQSDGREDRVLDYYKNEMTKTNTMLYLTRVSFCIFVVFAMFLLGMLFFFHVTGNREVPPPIERIIYQSGPSVADCVINNATYNAGIAPSVISVQSVLTTSHGSQSSKTDTTITTTSISSGTFKPSNEKSELGKSGPNNQLVFCFFNRTSYRRQEPLSIHHIPVHLCTHAIYSSVGVDESFRVRLRDKSFDIGQGGIEKFVALKARNSNLKVLAGLGETGDDWRLLYDMISDGGVMRTFAQNAVDWVMLNKFHGVVLNWLLPRKTDRAKITELVIDLKNRFTPMHLIVAVTLPHQAVIRRLAFEVTRLAEHSDFLLFNMFSEHNHSIPRATFPVTNEDVTLFPKAVRSEIGKKHFDKACFVLPLYGLSYTLRRKDHSHVGAAALGPGLPGKFTRSPGILAYNEICSANWSLINTDTFGTFSVKGNQWVGYHGPTNLRNIVKMIRRRHGARCIALWEVGFDDFKGRCGTPYPIMQKCCGNI